MIFRDTPEYSARELTRMADRYAQPIGKYFVYTIVGDLRINVETDEATYRQWHADAYPVPSDFTAPIEVTWWHTKQAYPFKLEHGGWTEEP